MELHTQRKVPLTFSLHSLATPPATAKDQIFAGNNCCAYSTRAMCEHIFISFLLLQWLSRGQISLVLCGECDYVFIILSRREKKFYAIKQADKLDFPVWIMKSGRISLKIACQSYVPLNSFNFVVRYCNCTHFFFISSYAWKREIKICQIFTICWKALAEYPVRWCEIAAYGHLLLADVSSLL